MKKRIDYKQLIICVAIPLLVGAVAGLLTRDGMKEFATLAKPPLSPPAWLFPVVWTILYTLMGLSSYIIYQKRNQSAKAAGALVIYGLQLFFNFFWPIIFFNLKWYFSAFIWLVLLWALIGYTILAFRYISKKASYLLYPYFVWVTFAGYLNLGIAMLN